VVRRRFVRRRRFSKSFGSLKGQPEKIDEDRELAASAAGGVAVGREIEHLARKSRPERSSRESSGC